MGLLLYLGCLLLAYGPSVALLVGLVSKQSYLFILCVTSYVLCVCVGVCVCVRQLCVLCCSAVCSVRVFVVCMWVQCLDAVNMLYVCVYVCVYICVCVCM